jgi:hypothetical protein
VLKILLSVSVGRSHLLREYRGQFFLPMAIGRMAFSTALLSIGNTLSPYVSTERGEDIARLTAELRNARQVATDALVGKAKDQLNIEGKDSQLANLRLQIERNVAASAAESDARLAAEMELIGAVTARDNFAAEIRELRAQLDASHAERSALRGEMEVLRAGVDRPRSRNVDDWIFLGIFGGRSSALNRQNCYACMNASLSYRQCQAIGKDWECRRSICPC